MNVSRAPDNVKKKNGKTLYYIPTMKKHILFFSILISCALPVTGSPVNYEAGYFGETLTHPGGYAAIGVPVYEKSDHILVTGLFVGSYIHPRNHTGLFGLAYGELVRPPRGFSRFSIRVMAGYYHTWPEGVLYGTGTDGSAVEIPNTGSPRAGFGIDAGWYFSGLSFGGFVPSVRLTCLLEYPYNGYLLPHLGIGIGNSRLPAEKEDT